MAQMTVEEAIKAESERVARKKPNLNLNIVNSNRLKSEEAKSNVYQASYQVAIEIIVKMCGGNQGQEKENEPSSFNNEIGKILIQSFVKHLRGHMHRQQKGFSCFLCVHSIFSILTKCGEPLYNLAKEKELINFLFTMMPYLFKEEAQSIAARLSNPDQKPFNLNSLIIGQGFQGQQTTLDSLPMGPIGNSQQLGQGVSNKKSLSSINAPGMQLSGIRQSDQQHPPASSPLNHYLVNKEERKGGRDSKGFIHKLTFNRATSEPPSGNKNSVMPVTEDQNDDDESSEEDINRNYRMAQLEEVQEEDHRLSRGQRQSNEKPNEKPSDKPVPPLQISQIQQLQDQHQSVLTPTPNLHTGHMIQPQTTINSSSMVMTSYLNMPLGLFSTTLNHVSSNSRQGGISTGPAFHNYKLNIIPQTTIAKSRLTRRQMSMSRKNTQKFSSISNFGQAIYGEECLSREQPSRRQQQYPADYSTQGYQLDSRDKSTSQTRKGPPVPKLNINQIVYDNSNQMQRIETGHILNTTSHNGAIALLTNTNILKSTNRSNLYSNQNFENQLIAASRLSNNNPGQLGLNPYMQQTSMSQFQRQMIVGGNMTAGGPLRDESDHNMSLYEDGSFIDEMEAGQTVLGGGLIFDNAEEKLRQLAIQLGEACLTNDLAALISQKREIELVKSARKTANSQLGGRASKTNKGMPHQMPQRSVSVSYNQEPFFVDQKIDRLDSKESLTYEEEKTQSKNALIQKTRLMILNLSYQLLKLYDNSEARFLKHPISALNSYLGSVQFKQIKYRQCIQALEDGKVEQNQSNKLENQKALVFSSGKIEVSNENSIQESNPNQVIVKILEGQFESGVRIDLEEKIIFKIYQKFTFVNEDILRNQVQNELQNFAQRERGIFGNEFPYQSSYPLPQGNAIVNQVPNLNLQLAGILPQAPKESSFIRQGSSQILNNTMDSTQSQDALSFMQNPNIMWSSSGIGYDLSTATRSSGKSSALSSISKDRIRKKLDVLLYTIDRRIKSLITTQFQQYHQIERLNPEFAKNLMNELTTLNAYLESQKSRIILYQVIEVILESLLMIKKLLVDLALKTSIYVMDFSKNFIAQSLTPDNMMTGPARGSTYTSLKSPHQNPKHSQNKFGMIKTQRIYRKLFSEYLKLLSIILSLVPEGGSVNQSQSETMKLLNELFITGDENWQESVKTYAISLFLSDISGTFSMTKAFETQARQDPSGLGNFYLQQAALLIEELRGINLVNLDEQIFLSTVSQTVSALLQMDHQIAMRQAKKSLYVMLICGQNCMGYFQSVLVFYQKAISQYFSHRYGKHKTKKQNSGGGPASEAQNNDDKDKNIDSKVVTVSDMRRGSAVEQASSIYPGTGEEQTHQQQKYWKQAVRRILYQYMYLITPPNGLLSSYILNNAINFVNFGIGSGTNRFNATGRGGVSSVSPTRATPGNFQSQSDPQNLLRNGLCPLNFQLTVTTLGFLRLLFSLPDKFTKYAFLQEEFMLFYIRTHYISYVRLYNKNFSKKDQIASSQKGIESKQRSMTLCKEHLECLFAIAQNRGEDTRRKLYQFKILQFLCQEIELEFECTTAANKQKRNRLLKEATMTPQTIVPIQDQPKIVVTESKREEIDEPPPPAVKKGLPLGIKSLNLSGLAPPSLFTGEEQQEPPKPPIEQPPQQLQQPMIAKKFPGFSIPKLNVGGLGLSEIVPDTTQGNNKTQIEIDQLRLLAEEQKKKAQEIVAKSSRRQQLSIRKSQRGDVKEEKKMEILQVEVRPPEQENDKSKQQQDQPRSAPPMKKPSFAIPKLNVSGLTLSEIVPGTADPPIIKNTAEENQQIEQNPQQVIPPNQPKKMGFSIPKLNVTGLGLSDLVPDDPKPLMQEEKSANTKDQIKEEENKEEPIQDPPIPQKKGLPFAIPKLNVAGLGLSELVPDEPINQQTANDQKVITPNQQQLKPKIGIPKLNVAGLGFSDLVPDEPAKQIEESKKDEPVPTPPVQKKSLPFSIPKLNVAGLGLSDLVPDEPQKIELNSNPTSKPKIGIPKLNVSGLGLSDLVPDPKPVEPADFSTLNPNNNEEKPIDYATYINGNVDIHATATKGEEDEMLFQQRQSERAQFENTAPVKMYSNAEQNEAADIEAQARLTFQGASAPQENRKIKKGLIVTRNDHSELSMQESLESAQYINFANRQNLGHVLNVPEDVLSEMQKQHNIMNPNTNQNNVRDSQQLRVESILDGQSMMFGSLAPTPAPEKSLLYNKTMDGPSTSLDHYITVNFGAAHQAYTPNPIVSQNIEPQIPFANASQENVFEKPTDENRFKLQKVPAVGQPNPILKKPMIPSLKIPEKQEHLEGKEKIQQQIAYSQQLDDQVEAGNLTKLQKELTKNNVKFQVLIDHQKSQKNLLTQEMAEELGLASANSAKIEDKGKMYDEEAFYMKERSMRPIYQDEELHTLMIALTICLLLTPERGTLDDLYCSQYPVDNGKQNILFLLHHHLNHPMNNQKEFIHKILGRVHKEVNPPLAGVRLLKLLCTSLFDISLYNKGKDWKKIAEGAYAKVFESKTNLAEPQLVAIKQLFLPKSIFDRCVLHDIFTEITCLEELRLEPCISDLYDYGVDANSYYIVMKRYSCSLRQWRLSQTKGLNENLSLYLSIYKEFLKSLMIIHSHNVTHYDIKCDNVFLDFNTDGNSNSLSNQFVNSGDNEEDRIKLTIGDFGECKIFSSEKDEFCQRNRGTDFCKAPEMLQLTINTRKDTDKYDRRKQVGTNRLSDVWSAGCLLYELLTGEYLFFNQDYLQFHFRVIRPSEALFTSERLDRINNNVYLIDFMKYMLVRDPRLRPSIENVLKRFEHVHALLVSTTGGSGNIGATLSNMKIQYSEGNGSNTQVQRLGVNSFEAHLEQATQLMMLNQPNSNQALDASCPQPFFLNIMEDVSLCNLSWFSKHHDDLAVPILLSLNLTHLILPSSSALGPLLRDSFSLLELPSLLSFPDGTRLTANAFLLLPQILDYLRSIALKRGRALFIEDGSTLMRECVLMALSHVYQTNAYETYTLIRSQNLIFGIDGERRLGQLSLYSQLIGKIQNYLGTYPRFQCKCGSCTIILKRIYANYINMETVQCNCSQYYRNIETSQCPSPGCNDYIQFVKTYFKVGQLDTLQWGFIDCTGNSDRGGVASDKDPFILGPKYQGNLHFKSKQPPKALSTVNLVERMLASNVSQTIDKNATLAAVIDKKQNAPSHPQRNKPPSAGGAILDSLFTTGTQQQLPQLTRWKLFKCKECQVWTHAVNEAENRYAILLNNRVKEVKNKNHFVNIRNLTSKLESGSQINVRVPILQKIKLNLPF